MKKMMFAMAAGVMALTAASAASADTFSPANSTFGFEGSVDVEFNFQLTCDMSVTVQSNSGGTDANVTAAGLSGGLCGLVGFSSLPWNVDVEAPTPPPTGVAATKLRIKGVKVTTVLGSTCGPEDIIVDWNAGPPATITIPVGTEINPPTPGCKVSGILTQTSGPAATITN